MQPVRVRAFGIPELVGAIAMEVTSVGDLHAMCLVNHAWNNEAERMLWSSLDSLKPLLRLFDGADRVGFAKVEKASGYSWQRFLSRCQLVKTLVVPSVPDRQVEAIHVILAHSRFASYTHLTPRLQSLKWTAGQALGWIMALLMAPSLCSLSLHDSLGILLHLAPPLPSLKRLYIAFLLTPSMSRVIKARFPELETLQFDGDPQPDTTRLFLGFLHSTTLTSLKCLSVCLQSIDRFLFNDVGAAIGVQCPNLATLKVVSQAFEAYPFYTAPTFNETIRPFLRLSKITDLTLSLPYTTSMSRADAQLLITSWPALERLYFVAHGHRRTRFTASFLETLLSRMSCLSFLSFDLALEHEEDDAITDTADPIPAATVGFPRSIRPFTALQDIDLSVVTRTIADLQLFITTICSCCPGLQYIYLAVDVFADVQGDSLPALSRELSPLLRLHNLKEFGLHPPWRMTVQPEEVRLAATSWPNLVALHICCRAETEPRPQTSKGSPMSTLEAIARYMPSCKDVSLDITVDVEELQKRLPPIPKLAEDSQVSLCFVLADPNSMDTQEDGGTSRSSIPLVSALARRLDGVLPRNCISNGFSYDGSTEAKAVASRATTLIRLDSSSI